MGKVVYTSKSTIERKRGALRIAHLPGEAQPVVYRVHGAIAEHYKVDPAKLNEGERNITPELIDLADMPGGREDDGRGFCMVRAGGGSEATFAGRPLVCVKVAFCGRLRC